MSLQCSVPLFSILTMTHHQPSNKYHRRRSRNTPTKLTRRCTVFLNKAQINNKLLKVVVREVRGFLWGEVVVEAVCVCGLCNRTQGVNVRVEFYSSCILLTNLRMTYKVTFFLGAGSAAARRCSSDKDESAFVLLWIHIWNVPDKAFTSVLYDQEFHSVTLTPPPTSGRLCPRVHTTDPLFT